MHSLAKYRSNNLYHVQEIVFLERSADHSPRLIIFAWHVPNYKRVFQLFARSSPHVRQSCKTLNKLNYINACDRMHIARGVPLGFHSSPRLHLAIRRCRMRQRNNNTNRVYGRPATVLRLNVCTSARGRCRTRVRKSIFANYAHKRRALSLNLSGSH